MVRIHDCSFHRSNPRNASLPVLIVYMEEQTEPKTQPRISLHPSSSIQGCHHRQDTIPVKRDMSSRRIGWEGANPLNGGLEMKKALISERQSRSLEGWKNRQTELDLPSARLLFFQGGHYLPQRARCSNVPVPPRWWNGHQSIIVDLRTNRGSL